MFLITQPIVQSATAEESVVPHEVRAAVASARLNGTVKVFAVDIDDRSEVLRPVVVP
jgi:hypothetical protein